MAAAVAAVALAEAVGSVVVPAASGYWLSATSHL
jgi:hypothetical protein